MQKGFKCASVLPFPYLYEGCVTIFLVFFSLKCERVAVRYLSNTAMVNIKLIACHLLVYFPAGNFDICVCVCTFRSAYCGTKLHCSLWSLAALSLLPSSSGRVAMTMGC